jgi:hypothetical protein
MSYSEKISITHYVRSMKRMSLSSVSRRMEYEKLRRLNPHGLVRLFTTSKIRLG